MDNKVVVYRENGDPINIELILSFKVDQLNKTYVAYTLNDDGVSEDVPLFISEYDGTTIRSISPDESKIVLERYEELKKEIMA